MKKIVVAPDSFKGSLSSKQVSNAIEKGIKIILPDSDIVKLSMSDGGEGFVKSILEIEDGKYRRVWVNDPLMRPIEARYGVIEEGNTAVIEMAASSGLNLLDRKDRNPMRATTYGVGELIKDAVFFGCKKIILGVGGSATNDGGAGMLQALGYCFFDIEGKELGVGGKILSEICTVDDKNILPPLKNIDFTVACDVDSPFYGEEGAAFTFAKQKGADDKMIEILDKGLQNFSKVIKDYNGTDIKSVRGSGAAGGLAGGCLAFLNAKLVSGTDFILNALNFDKLAKDADLVITGEGKMDAQTKRGKATLGILKKSMEHNIPVIAITGNVENYYDLNELGFTAVFSVLPSIMAYDEAVNSANAEKNIENTITQIMKVYKMNG